MAALQNYDGPAEVYVNGRMQAEAVRVSIKATGNNNPVRTMHRGFAGKSDGPRESEGTIESAIPRKGYETDFVTLVNEGTYVQLVFKSGGSRWQVSGYFEDASWNNAVDQTSMISANWKGGRITKKG